MGKISQQPDPLVLPNAKTKKKKKQKTVPTTVPSDTIVVKQDPDCDPSDEDDDTDSIELVPQPSPEERRLIGMVIEPSDTEEEDEQAAANIEVRLLERLKGLSKKEKSQCFEFECEWKNCGFRSWDHSAYIEHVEDHAHTASRNEKQRYKCEWKLCKFSHRDHSDFLGHVHFHAHHTKLKVHGASLSMLMKFPRCQHGSRTRNNISDTPTSFTCEWNDCDEKFNKAMEFYHHVRSHMTDMFQFKRSSVVTPFSCGWSNCEHLLSKKVSATSHTKTHTKEREIGCATCGATFYERTRYRDHCNRQLDTAYCQYRCDICDRYFATLRLLKTHKYGHNLTIPCKQCPLKFSRKSDFDRHMRSIHWVTRTISCPHCEYRACTEHTLNFHMKRHMTMKHLRCYMFGCSAVFTQPNALKEHIIRHFNIPPATYRCHLCHKMYTSGRYLSKHLNFAHRLPPPNGTSRYRFKVDDEDGVFRLGTLVDAKRKATQLAASSTDADVSDTQVELAPEHAQNFRSPLPVASEGHMDENDIDFDLRFGGGKDEPVSDGSSVLKIGRIKKKKKSKTIAEH